MTRPTCDICGSHVNTPGATRCWRHRGRRRLAPFRGGHGRPDPVTEATAAAVGARDGGCVASRLDAPFPGACEGPVELDHVDNAGLSKRGPSTVGNLVMLCRGHHRWKTEHARIARPPLIRWINRHAVDAMEARRRSP